MNKQTLFVTLTTAALMCGCQSSKVKISGRFVGGDAKNIYLEQVSSADAVGRGFGGAGPRRQLPHGTHGRGEDARPYTM